MTAIDHQAARHQPYIQEALFLRGSFLRHHLIATFEAITLDAEAFHLQSEGKAQGLYLQKHNVPAVG